MGLSSTTMKRLRRGLKGQQPPCFVLSRVICIAFVLLFLLDHVTADCECGYSTPIDGASHVFTDLLETNFRKVQDISEDTDWRRQEFNMTSERARGEFGEMFTVDNVVSNSIGEDGGGLQLIVHGASVDNMVPVAEIDSGRADLFWGTFRASLKLTAIPGTCAAFFWYYNDTAEMDMEFLSKDFHASNSSYPVNLVLQSREAAQDGYNAQLTGNFIKAYLPFDPTTGFHEYRMDFIPNKVLFYADGQLLGQMDGSAVPTTAGHLVLQHWSNGNPLWSGGPPTNDAVLAVSYVKAYFNSSTMERHRDWALRCRGRTDPNSVCVIPEVSASNSTPGQFFFSDQNHMANNQTVYGKNAGSGFDEAWWPMLSVLVLVGAWAFDLW